MVMAIAGADDGMAGPPRYHVRALTCNFAQIIPSKCTRNQAGEQRRIAECQASVPDKL
jgi:hypothetical protein